MPVTYDDSTTAVDDAIETITISHTMSATAGGILFAWIGTRGNTGMIPTDVSATWNGDAMTYVDSQEGTVSGVFVYGILTPDTGTHNCVFTWTNACDVIGGVISFTGASATVLSGTTGKAAANSASPSVTLDSDTDQLVFDVVSYYFTAGDTLTVGADQTEKENTTITAGSYDTGCGCSVENGAASVTMSWTISTARIWKSVAVPVLPYDLTLTPSAVTAIAASTFSVFSHELTPGIVSAVAASVAPTVYHELTPSAVSAIAASYFPGNIIYIPLTYSEIDTNLSYDAPDLTLTYKPIDTLLTYEEQNG